MRQAGLVPEPVAQLPWRIILLVLAIGGFGLVVLYSAAGGSVRPWASSQGIKLIVFLAGAAALSRVKEEVWKALAFPVYGALVLALLAVEVLGHISGGSQRWLDLGVIRLQPSELMKPAIALAVAVAAPLAVNLLLHDYQRNRILIFLDPESDPLGTGYHITQSKIAIGSGGIWGKGFLHGTQSHLDYLPEGHTDFVFATMAEEWGLVGGCLLILAFFLVIRWGIEVGQRAGTRFSRLVAAGLATTIFFYVAINLGMVMGVAPVVGIPLPLVSFGGSAQMTVLLCLGILMSIDRQNRRVPSW